MDAQGPTIFVKSSKPFSLCPKKRLPMALGSS
jgi:hypothetical protein